MIIGDMRGNELSGLTERFERFEINHSFSTPYYPKNKGLCEACNLE